MTKFIPGLKLSQDFFFEVVKPILDAEFPQLEYSAGQIGTGSEILGYDDEMSTDHHWGPRLIMFLNDQDLDEFRDSVKQTLRLNLPHTFRGYPTNFSPPDPNDNGTQLLEPIKSGPVNHRVEVFTLRHFFLDILGYDIRQRLMPIDWLTFPEQKLLSVTGGAVYWDRIGLQALRDKFTYYPYDIWLYRMAAGWARIGQEEHVMGRAGIAGDEIGSSIIGSRLVRDLMGLCFLMEKRYAPYPKWFGSAFSQLGCAPDLTPHLRQALLAETWKERQHHLCFVYEYVAAKHNKLKITQPIPAKVSNFHGRPFKVIGGEIYAEAIKATITDKVLQQIAQMPLIGGVDQFSDSTDLLSKVAWRPKLVRIYE